MTSVAPKRRFSARRRCAHHSGIEPNASGAEDHDSVAGADVSLDAGFVNFMPQSDPELDQLLAARQHVELAAPERHPLTRLKQLRLRDLTDAPFVWFPRRAKPAFYDQMMPEC